MIYYISDVHVGNHRRFGGEVSSGINMRCREVLDVLSAAARAATGNTLVVLGDLFDSPRPTPQVIAACMEALTGPSLVVVLVGNHDRVSDAPGDTALAPLAHLPNIRVVERPEVIYVDDTALICVPYLPGQTADSIEEAALQLLAQKHAESAFCVVCLHAGIKDANTPPWLADSSSAIALPRLQKLAKAHGVALVLSGDWHDHRRYPSTGYEVMQVGALVPTGWDNPGLDGYGTLVSFASDTGTIGVQALPGPRFIKGALPEVVRAQGTSASTLARPLRAVLIAADDAEAASATSLDSVVEIVRADVDVRAQAQQAAQAAKSATTLDEALARYIREMHLPDGITSAAVLDQVTGYLARAGGADEG